MKYRFKGPVKVVNVNIGKVIAPGDVVEVDSSNKELIRRLDNDTLFERVAKPAKAKKDGG